MNAFVCNVVDHFPLKELPRMPWLPTLWQWVH